MPALLALAAGFGLSVAIAWGSSTELGQTTATPVFGVQTPVVAVSTMPGTPSYETPDGVLTRWRFHSSADAAAGAVRLKIFRYTGTGLAFEVLAESSLKTLAPDTAYEFNERIPVKKGNLLGLTAVANAEVGITVPNTPGNQMAQFGGGDIAPGQTGTATIAYADHRPSVAATVESDADNDGFGDDTQDACPTDAKRQDPCPASPGDKRAPSLVLSSSSSQDVLAKRAVFVTVTSDENGTANGKGNLSIPGASRTFKLRSASKTVTAGGEVKLKLRVTRKALRAAKRSLRRGRRVRARVTITVRDGAGNVATGKKTVRVKRPKRR